MRQGVFAAAMLACWALSVTGPLEASSIKQEGMASWYKMGTRTANGERYDPMGNTAAHPSLPFNTRVRVTNPKSGDSVVVRINDRGPFTGGRIIDLSQGAAQKIKIVRAGVAKVKIEIVGEAAGTETAAAPEETPVEMASAEAEPVTESPPLRLMAEQRIGPSSR